jgi:hypothetical protein
VDQTLLWVAKSLWPGSHPWHQGAGEKNHSPPHQSHRPLTLEQHSFHPPYSFKSHRACCTLGRSSSWIPQDLCTFGSLPLPGTFTHCISPSWLLIQASVQTSLSPRKALCQMLMAHTCNPSYLGRLKSGGSQVDPANCDPAKSSQIPISKITRAKWTGSMVQAVECLLCKRETKFKPQAHQKIKGGRG